MAGIIKKRIKVLSEPAGNREKSGNIASRKRPRISFAQTKEAKWQKWDIKICRLIANTSDDFMVLCDFLGRARALKAIYSWNVSPKHALAINRHILVSQFFWKSWAIPKAKRQKIQKRSLPNCKKKPWKAAISTVEKPKTTNYALLITRHRENL